MIRLLALDLDGTVLTEEKTITPRVKRAILRAQELGTTVVLNTGRAYPVMRHFYDEMELTGPMICNAGAEVFNAQGEMLRACTISPEALKEILIWAEPRDVAVLVYFDGVYHFERVNEQIQRLNMLFANGGTPEPALRDHLQPAPKAMVFASRPILQEFMDWAAEQPFFEDVHMILMKRRVMVTAKGSTKGTALRFLAERMGILPEECMAIGDEAMDLEMLRYAGLGIAMKNSEPELLEHADVVCPSNEEDGVAQAIETYVLCDRG